MCVCVFVCFLLLLYVQVIKAMRYVNVAGQSSVSFTILFWSLQEDNQSHH